MVNKDKQNPAEKVMNVICECPVPARSQEAKIRKLNKEEWKDYPT
jgi:hypothetical protein